MELKVKIVTKIRKDKVDKTTKKGVQMELKSRYLVTGHRKRNDIIIEYIYM